MHAHINVNIATAWASKTISPKLLPLMKEQKNTIKYERMKESITWRYKQTRERKRERKQNKY